MSTFKRGIYNDLINGKTSLAIIGLTRSGLNLAQKFSSHMEVKIWDSNTDRVNLLKNGINPFGLEPLEVNFQITSDTMDIANSRFYIVTTSIALNEYYKPNLKNLSDAAHCISKVLKKRDFVVFETTSYPGCIEEMCIPILQNNSRLKVNKDFKIGFSPELFDYRTGNDRGQFKKLVAAGDDASLSQICKLYGHIFSSGVHKIPNIRLTEILRIIDRTKSRIQRNSTDFAF